MANEIDTDAVNESLDKFTSTVENSTGANQQLIQALKAAGVQFTQTAKIANNANTVERQGIEYAKMRDQVYKNSAREFKAAIQQMASGALSLSGSIMGAQGAFSSLVPTVDLVANVSKTLVNALTGLADGIPIISGLGTAAREVTTSIIEMAAQTMKLQLENAQRIANNFTNLAAIGANFGGSMDRMIQVTGASEIGLDTFVKIVNKNSEALVGMGGTIGDNAAKLGLLSKRIGDTNYRLLSQYGSYEALAEGAADYIALQNMLGRDELRRNQNLGQSVSGYLTTQRELTALTGKSAERMKDEEKARRSQIAYAKSLEALGPEASANFRFAMEQVGAKFGPEMARYMQMKLISERTGIVSQEQIMLQNFLGPAVEAADIMIGNANMGKEAFKQMTGDVITQFAPAAKAAAGDMETFGALAAQGYDVGPLKGVIDAAGQVNSRFVSAATAAEQTQNVLSQKFTEVGDATINFVKGTQALEAERVKLDKQGAENMKNMAPIVQALATLRDQLTTGAGDFQDIMNALANKDMKKLGEVIERMAVRVGLKPSGPTVANPLEDANNPPMSGELPGVDTNAFGGVATKPSIAGEDGPEAIIPLAKGNVPLDIDWTPMVRALYELIDKVQEGNDINDRILKASY